MSSEQTAVRGPHQGQPVAMTGVPLEQAKGALVLVHGRGATAPSILSLAQEVAHPDLAYLAPQAAGNTWYPYRFLAPIQQNEPWLSSGLAVLAGIIAQVEAAGIPAHRIILGGFSQGACLAAEFVVRNPRRYGGLLVFSGGLIGPPGTAWHRSASLGGMPAFLGCSDADFHIPKERVEESADVLQSMGAAVDVRLYPGMGHTINEDELRQARLLVGHLACA